MSSYCSGGKKKLIVDDSFQDEEFEEYGLVIPEVYLSSMYEEYFPQVDFSWLDDSVEIVRDNITYVYTKSSYTELHALMNNGEDVWFDGRNAPYSGTFEGKYLDERRPATSFTITVYNSETKQKTIYECSQKEVVDMTDYEIGKYCKISEEDTDFKTIINVIRSDQSKYETINDSLKHDVEFHKQLINELYNFDCIEYFSNDILENEELRELILSKDPTCLKYFSDELKNNKDYILKALVRDPKYYNEIPVEFKKDKDVILTICNDINVLKNVDKEIFNDRDFTISLIKKNPMVLSLLDDSYTNNKELIFSLIKYFPNNRYNCSEGFKFVSKSLHDDEELMKIMIRKSIDYLGCASDRIKNNKDFILEALKMNLGAYRFASKELQLDLDVIHALLEVNIESIKDIGDEDILIKLIEENKEYFEYLSSWYKNKDNIRQAAGLEPIQKSKDTDGFDDIPW